MAKLEVKLMRTGIASVKAVPIVGDFIAVLDELVTIWRRDPEEEKQVREIQDQIERLEAQIKMQNYQLEDVGTDLEKRLDTIKEAVSKLVSTPKDKRYLSILSAWISFELGGDILPESYDFASQHLNDLDLAILALLYDRSVGVRRVSVEYCNKKLPLWQSRAIAMSLSRLETAGFFYTQEYKKTHWTKRDYEPDLKEIDKFADNLRLLPIVAVMPNTEFVGIKTKLENNTFQEWLDNQSDQRLLQSIGRHWHKIRRHLFEGYQWIVEKPLLDRSDRSPDWRGKDGQYDALKAAMADADKALDDSSQQSNWYYVLQ